MLFRPEIFIKYFLHIGELFVIFLKFFNIIQSLFKFYMIICKNNYKYVEIVLFMLYYKISYNHRLIYLEISYIKF